jgi:hypothetical protein
LSLSSSLPKIPHRSTDTLNNFTLNNFINIRNNKRNLETIKDADSQHSLNLKRFCVDSLCKQNTTNSFSPSSINDNNNYQQYSPGSRETETTDNSTDNSDNESIQSCTIQEFENTTNNNNSNNKTTTTILPFKSKISNRSCAQRYRMRKKKEKEILIDDTMEYCRRIQTLREGINDITIQINLLRGIFVEAIVKKNLIKSSQTTISK